MTQWWDQLSIQERRAVLVGTAVLTLLIGYLLVWYPLMSEVKQQRDMRVERTATLAWMEVAAQQAATLKRELRASARGDSQGSLLAILEQTADAEGLRGYIQRIEPTGSEEAQIWIDRVAFDRLTRWLEALQASHAIVIKTIAVGREDSPGMVNARIVVVRIRI